MSSQRKRTYIYRNGYIKEDLTEVDRKFIQWYDSERMAIRFITALTSNSETETLSDYHIVKCRKTILGWVEVEGTERHL